MKKNLYLFFCLFSGLLMGQQLDSIKIETNRLLKVVENQTGVEKLVGLDSLSRLTLHNSELNYDAYVKRTIDYALELDSVDLAAYHTAQYIFYLANRAGKPEQGIEVFENFKKRKLAVVDPLTKAQLYLNGGDSYFFGGKTAASIPLYETAGVYALEAGDSLLLGKSKTYISDANADTGKFAEAGEILAEAELIFETMKDTFNMLTTRNSRANLYSRIGFYDEASSIRDEIITMAGARNDYRMLQSTLFNASIDARISKDYNQCIDHLKNALAAIELGKLEGYRPKIMISLFRTYVITDNLPQAQAVLDEIELEIVKYQQGLDGFNYQTALAHFAYAKGNYADGIEMLKKQFGSGSADDFGNAEYLHELLSDLYGALNNDKKALYHYKKLAHLKDSISNIQNVRALTYYQTLYETKRRDATIAEQQSEIAFLDVQNKLKRQWIIFGGIGIAILGIIGYLTWLQINTQRRKRFMNKFSQELIRTQEAERSRLARDLHDSVGQKLMLLAKKTKEAQDHQLEFLASSSLEEIRAISKGLHPSNIKKLGVSKSIEGLVNQFDANTDILFTVEIDKIDHHLNQETSLHLYRIVQELLNNVVKHSQTRSASVSIKMKEDHINLQINDYGKGFQFSEALHNNEGLGMRTLLERVKIINSELDVTSLVNKGTTIQLIVPFSSPETDS